jgi:GLPGLI family protein
MNKFFLITMLFLTFFGNAQNEGYVKYHISVKAMDSSARTLQSVSMLRGSKMELYFAGHRARVDFKMGEMYTSRMIFDGEKDSLLTLSESPFGNFYYQSVIETKDSIHEDSDQVELIKTSEQKKILGFNCNKQMLIQQGDTAIYWCTDEIKTDIGSTSISNPHVDGFPLEFSRNNENVFMSYKASNYREQVAKKEEVFLLTIPAGYKPVPQD